MEEDWVLHVWEKNDCKAIIILYIYIYAYKKKGTEGETSGWSTCLGAYLFESFHVKPYSVAMTVFWR